jgi:transcriptional regulator with GAF, ATPase, and Fis domain
VIEIFKHYSWPGNIREMSNTIERAVFMAEGPLIQPKNIYLNEVGELPVNHYRFGRLRLSDEEEKDLICRALEKTFWIQKEAARKLGLTPRALNYRIKKHGITHIRWRKNK